jgi:hypothetical protein
MLQRRQDVGWRSVPSDHLRSFEREPAGKHGEASKQFFLRRGEEIVAPGDRVAHRALSRRSITRSALQQRQAMLQAIA